MISPIPHPGGPASRFVQHGSALREREVDGDTHLAVGVLIGPGAPVFLAEEDRLEPVVLDPAEVVDQSAHVLRAFSAKTPSHLARAVACV